MDHENRVAKFFTNFRKLSHSKNISIMPQRTRQPESCSKQGLLPLGRAGKVIRHNPHILNLPQGVLQ